MAPSVTPVLLIILDGFGISANADFNAVHAADKPNFDRYWDTCPRTLIHASEAAVGLPRGQMGNSEVGHLNIGAGRVVYQDYSRIELAIRAGYFFHNHVLENALRDVKATGKALHVMGLLSDGGVHSHDSQIHAMTLMAARMGLDKVYIHAFLDGRDTPPKSAARYLRSMQERLDGLGVGRIATLCGRYYAMDRDKRWARVEKAYDLLAQGKAEFQAETAEAGLAAAYARGETDEFVKATAICALGEQPVRMEDGDAVVFMNFRADRAREITRAFTDAAFDGFIRERVPQLSHFCALTQYQANFNVEVVFPPTAVRNGFGEYISRLGLHQLRIAETEKYAHVTYFFNGGEETVYPGEDRILIKSPDVATYDLQPEMNAAEVTDKLVAAIESRQYQAIVCNYANADMVGHSGDFDAAKRAVEAIDVGLGRVVEAMRATGGETLIIADHGNAEQMRDPITGEPHTAHTINLVPFVYIGRPAMVEDTGALEDVAPTLLRMMGLSQPTEMGGHALVHFDASR
jgi:2,3-bisphosphoglycerate-independent phosphoglycerate mutase